MCFAITCFLGVQGEPFLLYPICLVGNGKLDIVNEIDKGYTVKVKIRNL
jgi:hypothetical protein